MIPKWVAIFWLWSWGMGQWGAFWILQTNASLFSAMMSTMGVFFLSAMIYVWRDNETT